MVSSEKKSKGTQKADYMIKNSSAISYLGVRDIPFELRDDFRIRIAYGGRYVGQIIHIHHIPERSSWTIITREIEKITLNLVGKENVNDHQNEKNKIALSNLNSLKEDIASGKSSILRYSMSYFIRAEPSKLRIIKEELIKNLRNLGVQLNISLFDDYRTRNKTITGQQKGVFLNPESVSYLIPVNYSYTLQDGGTFYGIDEITKAPVFLNRKKFPSSHELVLGMTGFGKSFFIKITMMREKISRGINVKIIDPLGEYENVSLTIGSKKIDLLNMEMNMFEKIEYLSIKENVDRALALFITLFDLNTEDKGIIDTALTLMFENDQSIKFLQEFIKNNRPETYSKISPLFEGSLRKFVTGKNPDLRGDVIINLGNIPKRLLSFYMLLSLDLIMRINEEKETNLIIDEAHYLMSEETVTSLERYLRHARHNNISMILISQSANDFSRSKSTISIMENCSIHILFRHQNVNDEIINFYNLDEKLIDFVKYGAGFNGKYSLAIMKVPGYESILRIESNKWEMGLLNEVRKS